MNKWIKRALLGAIGLGVLGTAGLAGGAWLGDRKAARQVTVTVAPVAIPTDASSLQRGRYLFATRGCTDCHGANGGGKAFIDDGGGMFVKAPNISPGPGNVVAAYRPEDWVRIIRHGIKPSGQPAFVMPSEDYSRLSDADLGALVAYVKQLPPVGGEGLVMRLPALVKTLYAAGVIQDAAEKIDHALPPAAPVVEDGSARHGAYVANMCIGCHGARLSGGKIPGGPPDWPAASNLTPGEGSAMAHYADAQQFVAMLRTGKRPDGSAVSRVMPFESLREMNDGDALALYTHLKALAPVPVGQR
ncbi:cytochrome c [Piscinibacter sp.]|uniref:cytochrome c n=1 Tax=Piscinibacter sp. TaxID=1903157 RepID=UPI002B68AEB8|nr:cytochrome c [Albitalea sp.]HUG24225.1 cytochrome c [Albitalea sp.]